MLNHPPPSNTQNDTEVSFARTRQKWLTVQIAYLTDGTTFHGTVVRDDLAGWALGFGDLVFMQEDPFGLGRLIKLPGTTSTGGASVASTELSKWLESLPPSSAIFSSTAFMAGALPDANAIVTYFRKHDPAGYATACFFAMVTSMPRRQDANASHPYGPLGVVIPAGADDRLRAAAELFFKTSRVIVKTAAAPRLASPEQTWAHFIQSLRSDELSKVMVCLTPSMQGKFRTLFKRLSREQLKAMADSFREFKVTSSIGKDVQEVVVVNGKNVGLFYFSNEGGARKITEM